MKVENRNQIIEKIYDAALDPSQWASVLRLLQDKLRSTAAGLYLQDTETHVVKPIELLGFDKEYQKSYGAYYAGINPWFDPDVCLMRPGLISTDRSLDEYYNHHGWLTKTEFFNDWIAPQEFRYRMGGTLCADGSHTINFTYFRSASAGPYSSQDKHFQKLISSHLTKALEINKRLENLDISLHATAHLVDRLPCGVILLDGKGCITFANRSAHRLIRERDGLTTKRNRIVACNPTEHRGLQATIDRAIAFQRYRVGMAGIGVTRFMLSRPSGKARLSLVIIPIPTEKCIFAVTQPAMAIFITDPEHQLVIEKIYLKHCYGLTSHEAGIAQRLAQGNDLRSAAKGLGLTYETARWYLKQIFEKTGTHRQADLVRLLVTDLAASIGTTLDS